MSISRADPTTRECVTCGASFTPYVDRQTTCSRRCREHTPRVLAVRRAHRQRPEVKERKNLARRLSNNPARREVNLRSLLRIRYGLTLEEYLARVATQGGKCFLCGHVPVGVKAASRLHVDHDHVTGRMRELLCNGCNRGLGYLRDDPALLRAAADYIERYRVTA